MFKRIGKQPPLKLKSAKIKKIQQKKAGPARAKPGAAHGPDRDRAAPGLARAGPALEFCIYFIFADFNLSGGCFPSCLSIFYKTYQLLYDF